MFVGNEGELGIWDTDDRTSDKQSTVATKGSVLSVKGSNDEVKFVEAQGPSWVSRSRCWSLIGECLDHVWSCPEP